MNSVYEKLKSLAFRTVPAQQANEAIAVAREELGSEFAEGVSYELVLDRTADETAARAKLVDDLLPRLIYFATSRRMGWPACPTLLISLFLGEELFFLRGGDFADLLVELSGETSESLLARHKA